jgi:hypothetical protein
MSSVWKLHADALVVLLDIATSATEDAENVAKAAEKSGDGASARSLHGAVQKLGERSDIAVKVLAHPGS